MTNSDIIAVLEASIAAKGVEIEQLQADLLTLALYTYGHDTATYAPETYAVMQKMAPRLNELFREPINPLEWSANAGVEEF